MFFEIGRNNRPCSKGFTPKHLIVVRNFRGVLRFVASKMLAFLGSLEVLEGLERSGRQMGTISCKFVSKPVLVEPSYDSKTKS